MRQIRFVLIGFFGLSVLLVLLFQNFGNQVGPIKMFSSAASPGTFRQAYAFGQLKILKSEQDFGSNSVLCQLQGFNNLCAPLLLDYVFKFPQTATLNFANYNYIYQIMVQGPRDAGPRPFSDRFPVFGELRVQEPICLAEVLNCRRSKMSCSRVFAAQLRVN